MLLLAQDRRLLDASEVWVGFDRHSVFHYEPAERGGSSELQSVSGRLPDAASLLADLTQAARGAEWFQVLAGDYHQSVPAKGIHEALDDVTACLEQRPA